MPRTSRIPRPQAQSLLLLLATLGSIPGAALLHPLAAQSPNPQAVGATSPIRTIDGERLHTDLRILAHDSLEGRRVGMEGNAKARSILVRRLQEIGVEPVQGWGTGEVTAESGGFGVPFAAVIGPDNVPIQGVNLVGRIAGTASAPGAPAILVGAHYDHLGVRDGEIYNGADDNASGTTGVLALAEALIRAPLTHTVIIALFDGEEGGLRGARAMVGSPPVPLEEVALMVNLDMVGRNDRGELYAVGTHHYPGLAPLVDGVAATAPITLLRGHDRPDLPPGDDWTMASDQGPFHQAGVPILYFGVEDHPDYHKPTDEADGIQPAFHAAAVETVLRVLEAADRALSEGVAGWR